MAQADATLTSPKLSSLRENNKLRPEDSSVHDWYRFVLSYPPHLVRDYLIRFGVSSGKTVLDPFCGTGTTLVECKKLGIPSADGNVSQAVTADLFEATENAWQEEE